MKKRLPRIADADLLLVRCKEPMHFMTLIRRKLFVYIGKEEKSQHLPQQKQFYNGKNKLEPKSLRKICEESTLGRRTVQQL